MHSLRATVAQTLVSASLLMVSVLEAPPAASQCYPTWTQAAPVGPIPHRNNYPGMAFDEGRGKAVIFGGQYEGGGWDGETWQWDGTSWSRFMGFSPQERASHGMAYDVAAQRVMIFGGRVVGPIYDLNDTQLFNGFSWSQVMTGIPEQRNSASMTYDRSRNRMVLFGGADRFVEYHDTWEWDGANWSRKATTGPSTRYGAGMAWDPNRGQVILYGGRASTPAGLVYYDETWAWDGVAWTLISSNGPGARSNISMTYDPEAGGVLLFGGLDSVNKLNDTWFWDGEQWSQVPVTSALPPVRSSGAMSADTVRREHVLFGGEGIGSWFNDTWRFKHGLAVIRDPLSRVLTPGATEEFTARSISYGAVTYQWRKDGVALVDGPTGSGSEIAGAATNQLVIGNTSEADLGTYDCVATNTCNELASAGALLYRTWYLDNDVDGFGDGGISVNAVSQPFGYVVDASDCNDSDAAIYPGAPELCDGIDQDCDTVADNAPPVSSRPVLEVTSVGGSARLQWTVAPSASMYDIVRGGLAALTTSAGDFAGATDACLADDLATTSVVDGDPTVAGDGAWYLVRGTTCSGAGSYDDGGAGLAAPRDASIAASASACP